MNNKNIVVITGGCRGIGASVVEVLASKGYNVLPGFYNNRPEYSDANYAILEFYGSFFQKQ